MRYENQGRAATSRWKACVSSPPACNPAKAFVACCDCVCAPTAAEGLSGAACAALAASCHSQAGHSMCIHEECCKRLQTVAHDKRRGAAAA